MPNLHDFERRLGGLVEGLFAKTFRSGLQPIEIAKRVLKEMEARRTVGVSEVWAPNHFDITISEADAARFERAEIALVAELKQVVRDNAAERGWGLVGPPEIELSKDVSLKKGDLECVASLVAGEDRVEPAKPGERASILIREDGTERTVALDKKFATIGRLPDCDIVLKDKGASRRHAQIREKDGGYTLTDLGSTNGTQLNGHTVQSGRLENGDRITIGATSLEFRSG